MKTSKVTQYHCYMPSHKHLSRKSCSSCMKAMDEHAASAVEKYKRLTPLVLDYYNRMEEMSFLSLTASHMLSCGQYSDDDLEALLTCSNYVLSLNGHSNVESVDEIINSTSIFKSHLVRLFMEMRHRLIEINKIYNV